MQKPLQNRCKKKTPQDKCKEHYKIDPIKHCKIDAKQNCKIDEKNTAKELQTLSDICDISPFPLCYTLWYCCSTATNNDHAITVMITFDPTWFMLTWPISCAMLCKWPIFLHNEQEPWEYWLHCSLHLPFSFLYSLYPPGFLCLLLHHPTKKKEIADVNPPFHPPHPTPTI